MCAERGRGRGGPLVAAVASLLLLGCSHKNPAPPGFVPPADERGLDALGAWVEVETVRGEEAVTGELVAVHQDTVFVLTGSGLRALSWTGIERGEAWSYVVDTEGGGTWVLVGSLATASHGVIGIFTLPAWFIASNLILRSATRIPREELERVSWVELARLARFPQGLGPEIDRAALLRPDSVVRRDRPEGR